MSCKIEEVKKILDKIRINMADPRITNKDEVAHEICQLFEIDDEPDWAGARHHPELDEPKPDESRLLTDEQMSRAFEKARLSPFANPYQERCVIAQAQLAKDLEWEAKTASIKDAEIKKIIKNIDSKMTKETDFCKHEHYYRIRDDEWEFIKKRYLK